MSIKIKIDKVTEIPQDNKVILNVSVVDGNNITSQEIHIDSAADKTPDDVRQILKDKLKNLEDIKSKASKLKSIEGEEIKL